MKDKMKRKKLTSYNQDPHHFDPQVRSTPFSTTICVDFETEGVPQLLSLMLVSPHSTPALLP